MVYFFVGIDEISKQRNIDKIKAENSDNRDYSFDYDSFYADDLDKLKLIDSLNRLPLQTKKRLVVIRQIEKLSPENQEIIESFLKKIPKHIDLVLDTGLADLRGNEFLLGVAKQAKIFSLRKERPATVFDLADAIIRKNNAVALRTLSRLIVNGENPHRLIGGLSWKWNNIQKALSPEDFAEGLELFKQADINIKLGRLKPDFALELLIVKLCHLGSAG